MPRKPTTYEFDLFSTLNDTDAMTETLNGRGLITLTIGQACGIDQRA